MRLSAHNSLLWIPKLDPNATGFDVLILKKGEALPKECCLLLLCEVKLLLEPALSVAPVTWEFAPAVCVVPFTGASSFQTARFLRAKVDTSSSIHLLAAAIAYNHRIWPTILSSICICVVVTFMPKLYRRVSGGFLPNFLKLLWYMP